MDEATSHGTPEGRASVRDFDETSSAGAADTGAQAKRGSKSQSRVFDEMTDQGRRAAEGVADAAEDAKDRATRIAGEAGSEIKSAANAWADGQSAALSNATDFMMAWQRDVTGFVNTRIERNVRFGQKMFEVRNPAGCCGSTASSAGR